MKNESETVFVQKMGQVTGWQSLTKWLTNRQTDRSLELSSLPVVLVQGSHLPSLTPFLPSVRMPRGSVPVGVRPLSASTDSLSSLKTETHRELSPQWVTRRRNLGRKINRCKYYCSNISPLDQLEVLLILVGKRIFSGLTNSDFWSLVSFFSNCSL